MLIVGIDLGTSTSEIAYVDESGKVTVIPNTDGDFITPSVVHIKRNGHSVVGSEAREYLYTRPESTFIEVKRTFGMDIRMLVHDKEYEPEEIQARIIEYLIDCAEDYTGEDVTGAVITVPAYFTDLQRKQTIKAGNLAGIQVERVINEPTAAALDYGLSNLSGCEYVLVYDFGGGTLDVTVLELFEGVIDVKSSCGNNQLGGKDFDELLMKHIAGSYYKKIVNDQGALMKLKQAAVACKVDLSEAESADVLIPLLTDEISLEKTVTRDEFEGLIEELVSSTGVQIDTALRDAGLAAEDIQKVILVGGTTRVPFVRHFVEEKMKCSVDNDGNPELMVVRGAAIQAAIIEGVIPDEKTVVLTDVCPFTLGVKAVTEEGFRVDPLIKRNVTIPYEYSKVYSAMYEYQRAIVFEIYQGESVYAQENTCIGNLELDKLPRRQNELAKAEVTFAYDLNGLLNVTARSIGNDNTVETVIDINNNDIQVRQPVKLNEWERADGASKYRPLIRKFMKIIDEYSGTPIFTRKKLFYFLDKCDELKACLIVGDKNGAEDNAEVIKEFLDVWTDPDLDMGDIGQLFESIFDEDF